MILSKLRKVLVLGLLMSISVSSNTFAQDSSDPLKSALDQKINIEGFG